MKTIAACVIGIAVMVSAVRLRPHDTDDFRSFYRAARLLAHQSVYAQPAEPPDQNGGRGEFLPYLRIPSCALALRPLAALPYASARRVWIAPLLAGSAMIVVATLAAAQFFDMRALPAPQPHFSPYFSPSGRRPMGRNTPFDRRRYVRTHA